MLPADGDHLAVERDAVCPIQSTVRCEEEVVLLDARQPDRYTGEQHPVDPLGGHIPTALNAPTGDNLGPDGRFLAPDVLAARYRALGVGAGDTVVSCGSGVTACHGALALALAGLPEPILYPGSWSDWCTSGLPYATGREPGSAFPDALASGEARPPYPGAEPGEARPARPGAEPGSASPAAAGEAQTAQPAAEGATL